jgi:hypothetical protein
MCYMSTRVHGDGDVTPLHGSLLEALLHAAAKVAGLARLHGFTRQSRLPCTHICHAWWKTHCHTSNQLAGQASAAGCMRVTITMHSVAAGAAATWLLHAAILWPHPPPGLNAARMPIQPSATQLSHQ